MTNPKNKSKIAVIREGKYTLEEWNSWCDGLYKALELAADVANIRVYGYCDMPATIVKNNLTLVLSDNVSSLRYWVNSFGCRKIIAIGRPNHDWHEVISFKQPKYLIAVDGSPDKKNVTSLFEKIVVKLSKDKKQYTNSVVAFGTNTDRFRELELNRLYPSLYIGEFLPEKRHNLWAKAMPAGSLAVGRMDPKYPECFEVCLENGHLVLPQVPNTLIPYLLNQSQGVCLTADANGGGFQIALEALSCNVPVLATKDSEAAYLDGVWTCAPEVNEIREAYLSMILSFQNSNTDLFDKYVKDKYDEYAYAQAILELI